ncbi:MAG: hypothetical protein MMC23_005974 [Stictis urceolatum]|nr:hypothetical protein [Stictis urceolata]
MPELEATKAGPEVFPLLPMFGDSQYDFEETDPPFNMSKPLDYIDSSPSNSNGPRTDAGFRAWSQVFAAHLIAFNTWGYNTSYGLFQAYYARNLDLLPSAISWVGSIQNFLIFFISTFSMHALVAGPRYYRGVLITGLALQLLGIFATSWCREYWQFLLAQGICQGVGSGLFFAPTVGLISTYFVKKRAIANAGMACGMSTGGIVFPLIARQLLQSVGFEWTLRVMGFVILFNSILILLLIRPIPSDTKQRTPFVDTTAFKDALLIKFALGMLMAVFGMYFAYYYTAPFAEDRLSATASTSSSLLLVLNGIGIPGRLIPAYLADRVLGPTNTLIIIVLCSGLVTYSWIAVRALSEFWVFVAFYGFFGASVQSLFPPSLGSLFTGQTQISVRIGMMFSFLSIGCLCGPPAAGALIEKGDGEYLYAQLVMGSLLVCGAMVLLSARLTHTNRFLFVKC